MDVVTAKAPNGRHINIRHGCSVVEGHTERNRPGSYQPKRVERLALPSAHQVELLGEISINSDECDPLGCSLQLCMER